MAPLLVRPAAAKEKEQKLRSVQGIVTDEQENPIPKAVVQLKNMKTLQVKSFYTDDKGAYRFHGLDPDLDYELRAEFGSATSGPRKLTPFDSRRDVIINFKLEAKK
ncbi:MAG TPA: carboxypeptidase-like regulatory domain-containing protein [Bryobacterales bacterium]|nr:carboxypeptidase-like regulatory domain-containing protein [Bryobacterales bacterium]